MTFDFTGGPFDTGATVRDQEHLVTKGIHQVVLVVVNVDMNSVEHISILDRGVIEQ